MTGASGFIGTYVRKALWEAGYETVSLVRTVRPDFTPYPNERVVAGTLSESDLLERELSGFAIDACVHLAWEGIPDYSGAVSAKNLEYGLHILRLCERLGISKLVISGSCWEYLNPVGLVSETAPLSWENPFKVAKNALHTMAEAFCREKAISCYWLRFFYVYGEGQRLGSLIPYIIKELQNGVQPMLNGAFNRNDFIHVSDVAHAVCSSLERMWTDTFQETFNIGSGSPTQVLDIVSEAARLLGVGFDPAQYTAPQMPPAAFWADTRTVKERLC